MKKNLLKLLLVFFLIVVYSYFLSIESIPDKLVIFEGENINIKKIFGINIKEENEDILETSSNSEITGEVGKKNLEVSLFDKISIKTVEVNTLPKTTVIPVGNIAVLKLYTNGVLVVGMSEIEGKDNKKYKPYENSQIQEGDTIIQINENIINSTQDLIEEVNKSEGENVNIKYIHGEETKECSIEPVKSYDNQYKLGLWVRDSAAGVGTVTFYEPETKSFGALGHGITDIDTQQLINIASGEFVTTRILDIEKGESGIPGRIQGTVENQENIGTIYKNTKFGIYGIVDNLSSLNIDSSKEMELALRDEIQTGKATILCSLDNRNVQEYEIEIEKIFKENNYDNKSMKIKITDPRLIEKTGGIIQGMSGSPIIQNGKFVGAVTHVLVNDPTQGYGIFGDIMLKQIKQIE